MKAWITKYALTAGIHEMNVEERGNGMVVCGLTVFHGEGREWHRTREAAVVQAEKMRTRRIAALKKSLAAMEKLSFS